MLLYAMGASVLEEDDSDLQLQHSSTCGDVERQLQAMFKCLQVVFELR